ncbi:hypothetical protein TRV_02090 [Trichophyton verrucosum HKI 0517]|uniref:Uncharacterized protein n=1 Tax=Trichophyton verrucosum (strain HKI 0517) TaxID=663202 RepID=D4D4S3_TRIVH|nr:uncharacterized protein TRV_02090 [Trichophyton verrucosum HKI 0517]EFE43147.1 hypothetical protein TRV_02090 [Trichophyton verrucosum HKI 0517]
MRQAWGTFEPEVPNEGEEQRNSYKASDHEERFDRKPGPDPIKRTSKVEFERPCIGSVRKGRLKAREEGLAMAEVQAGSSKTRAKAGEDPDNISS